MVKKNRVIFHGITGDRANFEVQMVRMGASSGIVDKMIKKAPIIMKDNLRPDAARLYAHSIREAGGKVVIQEYINKSRHNNNHLSITPLNAFTMCPECGLKQSKSPACVKCGFRL